ncbi:MAG: TrkA C-terminal domain-containing protein [Salinibacter sp.]
MAALLILLSVVAVSILVTRIATRAFMLTGLSKETAQFQARSIITGTGFTTDEADHIVNHPVRRRITLTLMLIGNAGLVTAVSTFVLSFTSTGTAAEALQRGLVLAGGLGVLAYLALSDRVDRSLSWLIETVLERVAGFQVRDMHTILNLGGGYMVTRMEVDPESWLAGKTLRTVNLPAKGLIVLAIEHPEGTVDYAPGAEDRVPPDGCLIAYGPEAQITQLCDQLRCEFDPSEAMDPS